jgi:hypothetical protein
VRSRWRFVDAGAGDDDVGAGEVEFAGKYVKYGV